jgi:hypothetical protein
MIPFLDVLVIREKTTLITNVYRKPTHTGRYINFSSNHPPHVKGGLVQSLHKRASTICKERHGLDYNISSLRRDLQLNVYPPCFTDSKSSSFAKNEVNPLGSVYILKVT